MRNPLASLVDPAMYKHVSSDDDKTTLKHKNGHVLTIAHKMLSPAMQSQLKALSGAGREAETSDQEQESRSPYGKVIVKAKGGEVNPKLEQSKKMPSCYADGGNARKGDPEPQTLSMQQEGTPPPVPKTQEEKNTDYKKGFEKGPDMPSLQEMWERLKNAKAGGGAVEASMEYAEGDKVAIPDTKDATASKQGSHPSIDVPANVGGAKSLGEAWDRLTHPMASGGKVRKYAEGDPDIGGVPKITGVPPRSSTNASEDMPYGADFIGKALGHGLKAVLNASGAAASGLKKDYEDVKGGASEVYDYGKAVSKSAAPEVMSSPVAQDIAARLKEEPPPTSNIQVLPQDQGQPPDQSQVQTGAPPSGQQPPQGQTPNNVPDAMDQAMLNAKNKLETGYREEQAGLKDKSAAVTALGKQNAGILQTNINANQDAQDAFAAGNKTLNDERLAHIQDIQNGHIDPDKYWDNHSKFATALGLIIGGFNPTNQPNGAFEMMKYQMDQNIKAQEKNLDSDQNLLRANLEQWHNRRDAFDATRLMQADIVNQKLLKSAADLDAQGKGQQAADIRMQAGKLMMDFAPIQQQFAMRQAMIKLSQGGSRVPGATGKMLSYADMSDPEWAKNKRAAYYEPFDKPGGVSIGSKPLPPEVMNSLNSHQKFDETARMLASTIQQNRGNLKVLMDPTNPASKLAAQQAMILQSLFREGTLGTVYREGEQPLLDKAIKGNPLSLVNYFSELPKLQGLMDSNMKFRDILAGSYGLQAPPEQRSQPHMPQQAAPQTQTRNGIKYQQVNTTAGPVWRQVK